MMFFHLFRTARLHVFRFRGAGEKNMRKPSGVPRETPDPAGPEAYEDRKNGRFFPNGPYPEREENRMGIFPPASGSKHRRTMIRYR